MDDQIAIIGDCHGCYDTLQALIKKLPKGIKLAFVGDLVDRGPKSAQVVEFVKNGGHDCVKGNHEDMMVKEHKSPSTFGIWLPNGGLACLQSYSYEKKLPDYPLPAFNLDHDLLAEHAAWVEALPVEIHYPELKRPDGRYLVITHSWRGKFKDTDKNFEEGLMWNRLDPKPLHGIYNVFGHTPRKHKATVTDAWANIDTGCCFKGIPGHGFMTALLFPSLTLVTQENIDD